MNVKKKICTIMTFLLLASMLVTGMSSQAASKIKLSKTKLSLGVGESTTLKLVNAKGNITWSSSNSKIVSVTKKGKVTAKKAGTVKITAKYKNKKYTCKVTAKVIKLNKSKLSLTVGKKYTLKLANATKTVKWTSSNKKLATVSSKGIVTAKKKGKVKITATSNGKRYVCTVTVKNVVYNTNPMISEDSISVKVGKTHKLSIGGNAGDIVWSSGNTKVATVKDGTVKGVGAGKTTIYAKVDGKTLKCIVKVSEIVRKFKMLTDRDFDYRYDYEDMASDNVLYLSTDSSRNVTLTNLDEAAEWSSANTDIITITKSTFFYSDNVYVVRSGKTEGTTFINVKAQGKVYTLKVVVEAFKLSKDEYTLSVGETIDITFPKAIDDVALMNDAKNDEWAEYISVTQLSDFKFRFKIKKNFEGYTRIVLWARGYFLGYNFDIYSKEGIKPSIDKNNVDMYVGDSIILNVTGTVVNYGKNYSVGDAYLEPLGNGQYKFTAAKAGKVELIYEFKNCNTPLTFTANIIDKEGAVLPDYGYDFKYDDKTDITIDGGKTDWVSIYTNHLVSEVTYEVSSAVKNCVGLDYFDGYDAKGHMIRLGFEGQYKGTATVKVKYKDKVVTTFNVTVNSDSESYKNWVEFRDKVHDAVWKEGMTDLEYLRAVCAYLENTYTYSQLDCWGGAAYMIQFGKDLGYLARPDNSTPNNPSHKTAVIIIDDKEYWFDCQGRKGE